MIKVTLEFKDVAETLDALFKLQSREAYAVRPQRIIDVVPEKVAAPTSPSGAAVATGSLSTASVAATPATKRRGRPPKNVAASVSEGPDNGSPSVERADGGVTSKPVAAAPAPKAPEANAGPSNSDALIALEKLFSKKGMPVAEATLKKYGATKLRELDRKHYPAFVKDCHDQVNA